MLIAACETDMIVKKCFPVQSSIMREREPRFTYRPISGEAAVVSRWIIASLVGADVTEDCKLIHFFLRKSTLRQPSHVDPIRSRGLVRIQHHVVSLT
jgi:hypothetical protein